MGKETSHRPTARLMPLAAPRYSWLRQSSLVLQLRDRARLAPRQGPPTSEVCTDTRYLYPAGTSPRHRAFSSGLWPKLRGTLRLDHLAGLDTPGACCLPCPSRPMTAFAIQPPESWRDILCSNYRPSATISRRAQSPGWPSSKPVSIIEACQVLRCKQRQAICSIRRSAAPRQRLPFNSDGCSIRCDFW